MPDAMLAYLYAVGVAADLGERALQIRARTTERAAELRAWTDGYLAADADARARMWRDGTGRGELVLDRAALACFDLVPAFLRRTLPHLASERVQRRTCCRRGGRVAGRTPRRHGTTPGAVGPVDVDCRAAESSYEVATLLIAVGRLGGDTRPWLTDPHTAYAYARPSRPALPATRRRSGHGAN
ncbi:hypothetical protein ABT330_06545 [Streptomyces sp. NPDC000658]|uniref:hypothetical protein n=1 Tax=Streptomyces sp. NPDC000658 TaxID=3154266 RepID=UPI00332070A2